MQKRLYRSTKDRMIAGVCGGLAEYFDVDPVIMRVLFVVITLGAGVGIIGYIILWIVVPEGIMVIKNNPEKEASENPQSEAEKGTESYPNFEVVSEEDYHKRKHGGRFFFAAILIIIGLMWFVDNVVPGAYFEDLWPLILVAIGLLLLLRRKN
jgi:phage shock protein C